MKVVSRFEANLLRILYGFLLRAPRDQVRELVRSGSPRPPCLGRAAVALVQEALAKGCVQRLAQLGGWRRERHLRGDRAVEGRLWERTPPAALGLKFSRHSLDFLIWITAAKLSEIKPAAWEPPEHELTVADWLLLYLAYDVLAGCPDVAERLQALPAFQRNALCRLAYPEDFTRVPENTLPDFAPWTADLGACILEVLQGKLTDRWVEVEFDKGRIDRWQQMQAVGRSQERVLHAFLQTVEQAGRLDLARFVLAAAAEVLTEDVRAERWTGKLTDPGPRLADRSETYRAVLVLPHLLGRLRDWTRRARSIGYFDEGYAASQLWLADWERWQGDVLWARAQALIQQLDPMKQT
ncbi:MAG TPA: hypothetical protein VNK04_11750 [Gemmataceae bacterium]|nr:hypothetical protein [Gemmataceae bacterium]